MMQCMLQCVAAFCRGLQCVAVGVAMCVADVMCQVHVCKYSGKSHMHSEKSPMYAGKSPMNTAKSLVYSEKSALYAGKSRMYVGKSPLCAAKSPMYVGKSSMYSVRAMHMREIERKREKETE